MALVAGATRQALPLRVRVLQPSHRQRTGDSRPTQDDHILVVVKLRTRPLRLIVTVIPAGVRVTKQTRSPWQQPQADTGYFKLRTPIMAVVTQR